MIQVHVRLRGGATRTLSLTKPLPIAQIRKTKSEVVAEIDGLLDHYCDREVAEVLNRQGRRTWQGEPFNLKKIAHIREAFNLKSRYSRLRAKGLLTAKEMSVRHGRDVHYNQCLGKRGCCCKSTVTTMSGDVSTNRWTRTRFSKARAAERPSSPHSPLHEQDKVQYET